MADTLLEVNIEEAGYEGNHSMIEQIEFTVKSGQLTGLIGPNGAGKSTTIKAIMGLLTEVKGTISFTKAGNHYAYIPEQPVYYETLTLWEHLSLASAVYGVDETVLEREGNALLERFRMTEVKHHLPDGFSKGMRQKMMLMIGFLIRPDIYIVDEPFVGLDPRATRDFLTLLEEERHRGAGVLMCTHVLDTAERICDDFVLLSNGRVVVSGELDDIRRAASLPEGTLFDCFNALT